MLGISDEMEAALAYVALRMNEDIPTFDDSMMPSEPFIQLKDANMLSLSTDWSHSLVVIHGITSLGIEHHQTVLSKRRAKWPISEEADALLDAIVANEALRRRGREEAFFPEEAAYDDFAALSLKGLLNIRWAEDSPYFYSVTEDGRSCVKGWFLEELEQLKMEVNIAPTFNNQGATATSLSTANNVLEISLSSVIGVINSADIDSELKRRAMAGVSELEDAAKQKDVSKFADAMEKVASIVKNATELGSVILPFAGTLAQTFGC